MLDLLAMPHARPHLRVGAVDAPQEAEAPLQVLLHAGQLLGAGLLLQAGRKAGCAGLHGMQLHPQRLYTHESDAMRLVSDLWWCRPGQRHLVGHVMEHQGLGVVLDGLTVAITIAAEVD